MKPYISYHPATRNVWVEHNDMAGVRTRIRALRARFDAHQWYSGYNPNRLRVFKLDEFEGSTRYVEITDQFPLES